MTVLSNLSQKPKVIIIHGMNNNQEAFGHLTNEFLSRGFEVRSIILPGHGEGKEKLTAEEALKSFVETFKRQVSYPYIAAAYSQGALYFELALNLGLIPKPEKAIYLAPAFFIKSERLINVLTRLLPRNLRIKSFAPKEVTRYDHMLMHEYKALVGKAKRLRETSIDTTIARLILVDPKDELVDPKQILKKYPTETVFHQRKLKMKYRYHLIFHPKYSSPDEWNKLMSKIFDFIISD